MLPEAEPKTEAETIGSKKRRPVRKSVAPALISTQGVSDRFSIHPRTIPRWVENGILPPPIKIRGRCYWPADVEPKTDAA
jgi:hypothetical protein